jgi:hypothetical protein
VSSKKREGKWFVRFLKVNSSLMFPYLLVTTTDVALNLSKTVYNESEKTIDWFMESFIKIESSSS